MASPQQRRTLAQVASGALTSWTAHFPGLQLIRQDSVGVTGLLKGTTRAVLRDVSASRSKDALGLVGVTRAWQSYDYVHFS